MILIQIHSISTEKKPLKKLQKKTKAIIVVSIFGQTADLISAKELCEDKGITLIEDAAQSFEQCILRDYFNS